MNLSNATSSSSIRLALTAHRWAQQFSRQQANPVKAKQVYLNTLSVCAVQMYLDRLGIDVDLTHNQSWNSAQQTLMDVADLVISGWGVLECRPVPPGAEALIIPPEVWSDRQGYVAVQLDESLRRAELLGWVTTAHAGTVPLTALTSLDELTIQLLQSRSEQTASQVKMQPERIHLGRWLNTVVDAGWHAAEGLLQPLELQTEFGFRGDRPDADSIDPQEIAVARCKTLVLSTSHGSVAVNLMVGLLPQSSNETEIWVQISPTDPEQQLPVHLRLMILDEQGDDVMNAQARATEAMQLRFTGQTGELFSVKVVLDQESVVEHFII